MPELSFIETAVDIMKNYRYLYKTSTGKRKCNLKQMLVQQLKSIIMEHCVFQCLCVSIFSQQFRPQNESFLSKVIFI